MGVIGQFLPDLLCVYFIIIGRRLESKVLRLRVRDYLTMLRSRTDVSKKHGISEESLVRLCKISNGSTTDFVAIVVAGTSGVIGPMRLGGAWLAASWWLCLVGLLVTMHLLWLGTTLDTVDKLAKKQKWIAVLVTMFSAALKITAELLGQ